MQFSTRLCYCYIRWNYNAAFIQTNKDTGHSEGLSKGMKGRAPGDLPGSNVGQHKAQLVEQVPHLGRESRNQFLKSDNFINDYTQTCIICWRRHGMHPNLAEENGHEVVVDEEGLWEVWIVKMEEERGEAQCDILLRWGTEGWAQQLHACYWNEQSSAAGHDKEKGEISDQYSLPSTVWDYTGFLNPSPSLIDL